VNAFGFRFSTPVSNRRSLPVVILYCVVVDYFIFVPLDIVMGVASNLLMRFQERQADAFALALGYGKELCESMLVAYADDGIMVWESPLKEIVKETHPNPLDRCAAVGIK